MFTAMWQHRARQGELYHRYVLGVYDLMESSCAAMSESAARGLQRRRRTDLMQVCCIIPRRSGAAIIPMRSTVFPSSTEARSSIRSAPSAPTFPVCPNHQTCRVTLFRTRGDVALAGSFGYEMDLNKISEEEKEMVKEQVAAMHEYYELTHEGLYYRLTGLKQDFMAWEFVAEDQSRASCSRS